MSSETAFTGDDEGTRVLDTNGDTIGRVIDVRQGIAFVEPDPSMTDSLKSTLGWTDNEEAETYRLEHENIQSVSDDAVRLKH